MVALGDDSDWVTLKESWDWLGPGWGGGGLTVERLKIRLEPRSF